MPQKIVQENSQSYRSTRIEREGKSQNAVGAGASGSKRCFLQGTLENNQQALG